MDSFKDIRLVVSDFDGIFTDGKLTVYSNGTTSKTIDYKDIMAIAVILKKGIKFAIISGESSGAIDVLKEKFPNIDVFQNERKKLNILQFLAKKYQIPPQNIIYLGDDINDTDCLNFVGNPITVPNAHISLKSINNINITSNSGGNGVLREVADLLL